MSETLLLTISALTNLGVAALLGWVFVYEFKRNWNKQRDFILNEDKSHMLTSFERKYFKIHPTENKPI